MKQKKQIIMLPSEKDAVKGQILSNDGKLLISPGNLKYGFHHHKFQHLYILSDEEPKMGEWCYSEVDECIYFVKEYNKKTGIARHIDDSPFILDGCKKIIATTDPELTLKDEHIDYAFFPKEVYKHKGGILEITQHIIEAYVKKPFDEVEVDYYDFELPGKPIGRKVLKPKLNQDGTLAVSLVEEKMYSRDEVEELCRNSHLLGMKETLPGYPKPETIDEWIKENL